MPQIRHFDEDFDAVVFEEEDDDDEDDDDEAEAEDFFEVADGPRIRK